MKNDKASRSIIWTAHGCLQCNVCSLICPTGALRPIVQEKEAVRDQNTLKLRENSNLRFAITVSAENCTGCGLCTDECPAKEKPLCWQEGTPVIEFEGVKPVNFLVSKDTVRGSQFEQAMGMFPSACPGCAQAIYVKLLTQLFGQRVNVAGIYGCFRLAGVRKEDEAEAVTLEEQCRSVYTTREELKEHVRQMSDILGRSAKVWAEDRENAEKTEAIAKIIMDRCQKIAEGNEHARYVLEHFPLLKKPSVWTFGGDGISDAEESEVRALLRSDINCNIVLFETGDPVKSGKAALAQEMREAGDVFVAQIAVGANYKQTLRALQEAERHEGPSLIVAYAPCVGERVEPNGALKEMRAAVRGGIWELFCFDPEAGGKTAELRPEAHPSYQKGIEKWTAVSREQKKHPMEEQGPAERIKNFEEIYRSYSPAQAIREAKRCLRCRERPCMKKGCPVHNRIPDFIEQIAKGKFEAAYQILSETTSLPAVCGRVCQQSKQCEGSCVRGIKGQPVAIGNLERFVADWHCAHIEEKQASPVSAKEKVAVIGSGPSGIACAGDLADWGYQVTVYEKTQVLGGVLTYGIPEFRLPKGIVQHEIEKLKQKGVQFCTGMGLGEGVDVKSLLEREGFSAVYLANGAGIPVRMNIPGEDAAHVYSAADYLMRINVNKDHEPTGKDPLPPSKKIVVVGGGNVAMDACRAAVRTGAENVYVLYRRSEAEMPADPVELREAREEGVQFCFLTNPVRILATSDGVCGIECVKMELGEPDASGRRSVKTIEGSEFVLDADCVIMALGTSFDRKAVRSVQGIEVSEKGGLLVDENHAANLSGIFAGGDAVTGPASVIRAMGAGKKAARGIHAYFQETLA